MRLSQPIPRRLLELALLAAVCFFGPAACGSSSIAPAHAEHAHTEHTHGGHHAHHGSHEGCATCQHAHTAASADDSRPLVAPGEAGVGDRTRCPVSGEEFVVAESSPSAQHEGKTYYFCCAHCAEAFGATPERYIH